MHRHRSPFVVPLVILAGTLGIQACGGDGGGTDPITVTSVTVTVGSNSIEVGATTQASAVLRGSNGSTLTGRTVTWTSSDVATATVSSAGLVTGVAEGTTTITATSEGKSGTASVSVTPVPVGSVAVSSAGDATSLDSGATLQLSAEVRAVDGSVLQGRTVNWSSSDDAIATVDATGLVTGVAKGDVTITGAASGQSGTIDLAVTVSNFAPTGDTNVGGEMTVDEMTVPDGVTVTVTEDVTITAEGQVTIAGTLTGDCVAITVTGSGALTLTGSIDNSCSDGSSTADITLVGNGVMDLTNVSIVSSGNVVIKNDPTLNEAEFADLESNLVLTGPRKVFASAAAGFACGSDGARFAPPAPASNGTNATSGDAEAGEEASTWTLFCSGDLDMDGGTDIEGEDGGNGGNLDNGDETDDGLDSNDGGAGNGGRGGFLRVRARGNINFNGDRGGTRLRLGSGGNGGDDTRAGGGPGASATARGGDGGDSGSFSVLARGGIDIKPGGLTIILGTPGKGGTATAFGRDGLDAGAAAAQPGGSGTAIGGKGGSHPTGRLTATGNVTGAGNAVLTGPPAADGGAGRADGGDGGEGNEDFPAGAKGGAMTTTGGKGGDATTRDLLNVRVANGGIGGAIDDVGGWGGNGWNDCKVGNIKPGGAGGAGGDATGTVGLGGTGLADGANGAATVGPAGNGGIGGNGENPGVGGAGGANGVDAAGNASGVTVNNPSFEKGKDGENCIWVLGVAIGVTSDPEGHETFIGLTATTQLTVNLPSNGVILIVGNGVIPDLSGEIADDGTFTATGLGTLASTPGTLVTLTGTFDVEAGILGGVLTAFNSGFPPDPDATEASDTVTYSVTTVTVDPPGEEETP